MKSALSPAWSRINWTALADGCAPPSSFHRFRQIEISSSSRRHCCLLSSISIGREPNQRSPCFRRMFKRKVGEDSTPLALVKRDKIEEDNSEDEDDEDQPFWMEEDDPNWPEDDPSGEGVGFRVSNFFEPKIMNVPNEDTNAENEELSLDWEAEQHQWVIKEITSIEWDTIVHEDPTPLIFFAFERYGPRGADCWKLLEELEKVVRTILGSRKYPIRAVKLDVSSEPDVGAALEIKTLPALLFIKGCKLLHRQYGLKTEQELLAITSHLFYHSARPDCMDELDTSHVVTNISSSR